MNNNDVINTLKQAGFRVRVQHFRRYRTGVGKKTKLAPKTSFVATCFDPEANGGITRALVLETTLRKGEFRLNQGSPMPPNTKIINPKPEHPQDSYRPIAGRWGEGVARCATDDPFNKSQGVRFALRDALINLGASFVDDRQHMLLVRCVEQLEQVENEYQEDLALRAEANAVQHMHDDERWGAVRQLSESNLKRLSREERLTLVGAERERIEMLRQLAATPTTADPHAY